MFKKIAISLLILIIIAIAYIKYAISKFDYDFSVKSYSVKGIDLSKGALVNIVLDLVIKSALFFNIPVKSLYYEIYYKDRLLGRSAGASDFVIKKKGEESRFSQSIDLVINKFNIEVAANYLSKTPTDFTAKVKANVLGININLKNIKFTY